MATTYLICSFSRLGGRQDERAGRSGGQKAHLPLPITRDYQRRRTSHSIHRPREKFAIVLLFLIMSDDTKVRYLWLRPAGFSYVLLDGNFCLALAFCFSCLVMYGIIMLLYDYVVL